MTLFIVVVNEYLVVTFLVDWDKELHIFTAL